MARTVTRLQILNRAYQLANMENATTLWPNADVRERINTHLCEEYDLFRQAAPPHYYSSTQPVSVASGVLAYPLPDNFLDLQEVYIQEGASDRLRPIRAMRRGERPWYVAPTEAFTAVLEYTPTAPSLDDDNAKFDGVNGWDDLIVLLVVRDMLTKGRESTEQIDVRIAELRGRIRSMGNRDRSGPRYLRDVEEEEVTSLYSAACYRLRAGTIEFYEHGTAWP